MSPAVTGGTTTVPCSALRASLCQGIAALGNRLGVLQRLAAGQGEGDDGVAAESDAGEPAADAQARAGRSHLKDEGYAR